MRARLLLPIPRIALVHPFRPPNSLRLFTQNTQSLRQRPQLPFLHPSPKRRPAARYITTETKKWIKSEFVKGTKWTIYIYTFAGLSLVIVMGLHEEWCEHQWPTPAEWTWSSRRRLRTAQWAQTLENDPTVQFDWGSLGQDYRILLRRLEDPEIDGAGLEETQEGGTLVAGVGKTGYNITKKSEPWRRGYYTALMGTAKGAEQMDGWVKDTTRNVAFPGNVVVGPSNPIPKPLPLGSPPAPKEEDCESAFEGPEVYYMRILTTQGFTEKQRVDSALAYANWLDFKQTPEAALEMYKWALDIATAEAPKGIVDSRTGILNTNAGVPSANILATVTGLAVHHAETSNLNTALPILISILRARKMLPLAPVVLQALDEEVGPLDYIISVVKPFFVPGSYPPPPEDGTAPPLRTSKEICEEAGIMTYIGEILYVSKSSKTSQEEGLAWTREAVDIAEVELRKKRNGDDHKERCKECMKAGLSNWSKMVAQLAEDAKASKDTPGKGSWLGFGGIEQPELKGRWETEQQVVKERARRAEKILDATEFEIIGSV